MPALAYLMAAARPMPDLATERSAILLRRVEWSDDSRGTGDDGYCLWADDSGWSGHIEYCII